MPFNGDHNERNGLHPSFIGALYMSRKNPAPARVVPLASARSPDLKAVKVYRGVSVYKVRGSQYWYVRVWDRDKKRYIVKGTGETSLIAARDAAKDHALALLKNQSSVEREFTFQHFAITCLSKTFRLAGGGD